MLAGHYAFAELAEGEVMVLIEHCHHCEQHQWNTRHKKERWVERRKRWS
jgi:hypothetical protein